MWHLYVGSPLPSLDNISHYYYCYNSFAPFPSPLPPPLLLLLLLLPFILFFLCMCVSLPLEISIGPLGWQFLKSVIFFKMTRAASLFCLFICLFVSEVDR